MPASPTYCGDEFEKSPKSDDCVNISVICMQNRETDKRLIFTCSEKQIETLKTKVAWMS